MTTTRFDRFSGALLGLAAADAVGTTLEFRPPGTFTPITDMVGGGPFGLQPGQWTDDTSMALCLAASLVERRGFDARDQMERYVRWWRSGYMSSTDRCFDIGNTVSGALRKFEATGEPFAGSTDPHTAGNGSIMRLAPVPMVYVDDPALAIQQAGESSKTTHATPAAVDACRFLAGLLVGAINGAGKEELLSANYSPLPGLWDTRPLHPKIAAIAAGSYQQKNPPQIRGTGYVVDSLEAALWAFYHATDFRDGCLKAANLGDDADTTAAVYGQIAGAYFGASGIPSAWLHKLARRNTIEPLIEQLYQLAQK
jgi:ADP-ribosylglycohydrolase